MIYPIHHLPDKIPVGVQTEQDVEDIGFDLKHWLAVFPDMVFTVWATRPGEQDAYPVNEQMLIGSVLYWHPDGYDTAIAGEGRVEIVGVGENRRKLSGFVPTVIHATSMGATKEPGENTVPWYEKIINAAMEIAADVDVGAGGLYLVNAVNGTADRTQEEIRAAVAAGQTCLLVDSDKRVCAYFGEVYEETTQENCPTFVAPIEYEQGVGFWYQFRQVCANGYVSAPGYRPARTPNPKALTFTGAGETSYDGSKAVSVEIPDVFVITLKEGVLNRTYAEIVAAIDAARPCILMRWSGDNSSDRATVYIYAGRQKSPQGGMELAFTGAPYEENNVGIKVPTVYVLSNGTATLMTKIARTPSPYALTVKQNGETNSYNGSKAVSVEIPTVPEDAGKLYIVTVVSTSTGWVSDRSRAEIDAAQAAGKACLMHFPVSGEVMVYRGNYKFASNVYSNNASAPGLYFDWAEVNADQTVDKYGGGPLTAYPGAVSSSKGTCYLRWNGTKWQEATIAQLKSDLGLT